MKTKKYGLVAAIAMLPWVQAASAEDGLFGDLWNRTNFNGQFRVDASYRTTGFQNPYNQNNMPYQDVPVTRQAYVPPALSTEILGIPLLPGQDWNIPLPGFSSTVRRSDTIPDADLDFNTVTLRFDGEMDIRFTDNLRFNARLRTLYDPTIYDEFDANDVSSVQGGIREGLFNRYADIGRPNYYENLSREGKRINPLELAGRNYMADLPTLILNYKSGNYDIRFGNQQIAWGQAIFFRTFDVANGLDLRRHLILDRGIEEFEDERVPKIALRAAMQISDSILVDSFVGKFQPDVLPNPNTPYNVIPSQFYKPLDNYFAGDYDRKLDFGIRFKADYGDWGWQAIAVSRYNPLGTFRWAESGIENGLYSGLGDLVMTAYGLKVQSDSCTNATLCRLYGNFEEAMSHTPFTVGPAAIYSGREYMSSAAGVRLDGWETVNAAVRDFPAMRDIYATEVDSLDQALHMLDTFIHASGGSIRGTVQRDYHREQVFGLGTSYVTSLEDVTSFWDSIILNLEVQYTPERVYTHKGLSRDFLRSDEYIITAVAEKWHRWSAGFPAAYLVAQYMHRSESDLIGLHLSGYGGPLMEEDPFPTPGIANANYFVFAGFQPTPNRKFIFEWAMLYDVKGGLLFQPNVRWNAGKGFIVDVFYNYVDGSLHGKGRDTLTRAIDSMDEISVRLTYQL